MAANSLNINEQACLETRWNRNFEALSNSLRPFVYRWTRLPQRIIRFEQDGKQFFGLRPSCIEPSTAELPYKLWGRGDEFILDFFLQAGVVLGHEGLIIP